MESPKFNPILRKELWNSLTEALTNREALIYIVDRQRRKNRTIRIIIALVILPCCSIPTFFNDLDILPKWGALAVGVVISLALIFKEGLSSLIRKDEELNTTDKLIKTYSIWINDLETLWLNLESDNWSEKKYKELQKIKSQMAEKTDELNKAIPYLSKNAEEKLKVKVTKYMDDKFRN